ncbi:MAG TPA: hypothetical protein VLB69_05935, partial [Rudaea sp.]|nr:hypothetical protein [Rudaea sp.]
RPGAVHSIGHDGPVFFRPPSGDFRRIEKRSQDLSSLRFGAGVRLEDSAATLQPRVTGISVRGLAPGK